MSDRLSQTARIYCDRHRLRLAERLGFGVHGIVHVAEDKFFVLEELDIHMVDVSPRKIAFLD